MTEPVTATAPPTAHELAPPTERTRSDTTSSREAGHAAKPDIKTLLASPTIAIHADGGANNNIKERRPSLMAHISAPATQQYQSPLRHHKRTPSQHREVKETLNARSEYTSDDADGTKLRINQYIIREEIGRGSYGAVHVATDQFGIEFAIKEFSKSRLRKRAQSNILRRPPAAGRPGRFPPGGRGGRGPWPAHMKQLSQNDAAEAKDALFLIREEIAIMKKLNHPNLVQLIEVLDDPEEDSLWMVLEMCKKGVVMKVGLDDHADPYPEEQCRHWFRDLILGIEYLHAQGVIHRDIKPDNLLLTEDDVLKIVDFGVSEIFEKPDTMMTAKSAGSPAFLPPELCVAKHGDVSGKAADIWAMGVTLYCLKYGKLPFKRDNVLEMYEAIRNDVPEIPEDEKPEFRDLITRLLDKDASTRICMSEIREHPWVTLSGADPLLSEVENCSDMVDMPNELEVNHAFTPKMSNMLTVMIAINKFKGLLSRSRPSTPGSRTPRTPRTLQIPNAPPSGQPAKPVVTWNPNFHPEEPEPKQPERREQQSTPPPPAGRPRHKSVAEEAADIVEARKAWKASNVHPSQANTPKGTDTPPGEKGHAHTPTDHSPRLLGIGLGGRDEFNHEETPADIVSDSPTGIDFNLYDRAFEAEIERIRSESSKQQPADGDAAGGGSRRPHKTTYLTRFVNEKEKYFGDDSMILEAGRSLPGLASAGMSRASAATTKALGRMHLGGARTESGSRGTETSTPTPAATAAAAAAMAKAEDARKKEKAAEEEEEKEKGTATATRGDAEQQQQSAATENNDDNTNKTTTAADGEPPMTLAESYENVKDSVHKFADVVASTMQAKLGGLGAKGGAAGGSTSKE